MGIYLTYDNVRKQWKWSGFMFVMYFDTEEEAKAKQKEIWEMHTKNLNAFRTINDMLVSLRKKSGRGEDNYGSYAVQRRTQRI